MASISTTLDSSQSRTEDTVTQGLTIGLFLLDFALRLEAVLGAKVEQLLAER